MHPIAKCHDRAHANKKKCLCLTKTTKQIILRQRLEQKRGLSKRNGCCAAANLAEVDKAKTETEVETEETKDATIDVRVEAFKIILLPMRV